MTDNAQGERRELQRLLSKVRAYILANADDLSMGSPAMDLCDEIDAAIGPTRLIDIFAAANSRGRDG